MIQPHPEEEGWEAKRFREAEEKKLFALHSENQRLLAQQYEFEGVIADYAHKIDSFSEKSRKLEEESKELRAEVEDLSSRSQRAEDALAKRNEEYCTLYNYLFTEKRGTLQDAFLKEIDLTNRLNEIQHESDTQIINKLKNTIKSKNEELLRNSQRITELNEALITSSFEYQQKIDALKGQNSRLQKTNHPVTSSLPVIRNISEYCLNKKIESLLKQVSLYQQQLNANKRQLAAYKKKYSVIEGEKVALESQLSNIKNSMPTLDSSIYDVIKENNELKDLLEKERIWRNQDVQRRYSQLAKRPEELNRFINAKSQEQKLKKDNNQLNKQLQRQRKELDSVSKELKTSLEAHLEAVKRYESLRVVSTSAIQKLKNVISTYVPYYFRRGGLENYNLDKEEQEFLAQRNVEKTLQAAYQQINSKIAEAQRSKQREVEAERKSAQHLQRICQLEGELARKESDVAKLSESVESLMEAKKSHDCNRYIFEEGYEQDELNQIVNDDQEYVPRLSPLSPAGESLDRGYQIKIEVLEKAIEELQADRSELIDIIKVKEMAIAQLTADVKALSSTSHIRALNIQSISFNDSRPKIPEYYGQQQLVQQERAYSQHELSQIRAQLRQLSSQHKLEKQLLIKESEQKEALSMSKYLTLLKHFNDLTSKYNALEASASNNPMPEANSEANNAESASQLPLQLPEANNPPQRDQPTISESAIENFTDTLKKYEKEIHRFVGIYEAQIKKSMEGSMVSEMPHESEGESQHSEDQVERLHAILSQHHDTIKNLESLLEQKNSQSDIQVAQLESALKQSKEEMLETSKRLEAAEATIAGLKSQILSEKTGEDFTSSESANTAFVMLNAKNKQIDELKAALEELRRSYEDKSREAAKLSELSVEHSQVEAEEYRLLREIMEEENLVGVLEAAARRLA